MQRAPTSENSSFNVVLLKYFWRSRVRPEHSCRFHHIQLKSVQSITNQRIISWRSRWSSFNVRAIRHNRLTLFLVLQERRQRPVNNKICRTQFGTTGQTITTTGQFSEDNKQTIHAMILSNNHETKKETQLLK